MKGFIEVRNEDFENEVELVNVAHIIRVYPDLSKRHAMIALDDDYVLSVDESPEEVRALIEEATTNDYERWNRKVLEVEREIDVTLDHHKKEYLRGKRKAFMEVRDGD
jgi:phytoene dehydrogenase-like protein